MYRTSLAFALALLSSTAFAQVSQTGAGKGAPGGAFTPSCSQSSNFLARATGVTSNTDKTNYDTMICGLVTDGVWSKLDALYVFAAVDRTTAKLNLVSSS